MPCKHPGEGATPSSSTNANEPRTGSTVLPIARGNPVTRFSPLVVTLSLGLSVSGCIHEDVVVSSYQVHRHVPELRSKGEAEVQGLGITPESRVVARTSGRWLTRERQVTVGKLIENCPDVAPVGPSRERAARDCLLLRTDSVNLGDKVDWGKSAALWGGAGLAVVAIGVAIGVLIAADSKDSQCDISCQ